MEQEELELIKRLQNTQIMQKTAYDDLENALNASFNRNQQEQNLHNPPSMVISPGNGDRGLTPNKGMMGSSSGARPQTSQSSSGVKYKQQIPPAQKNNN